MKKASQPTSLENPRSTFYIFSVLISRMKKEVDRKIGNCIQKNKREEDRVAPIFQVGKASQTTSLGNQRVTFTRF